MKMEAPEYLDLDEIDFSDDAVVSGHTRSCNIQTPDVTLVEQSFTSH